MYKMSDLVRVPVYRNHEFEELDRVINASTDTLESAEEDKILNLKIANTFDESPRRSSVADNSILMI